VSSTSAFWFNFTFGEDPTIYGRSVELFVRHTAAPGGASYMNMLINWPPKDADLASNPYSSFYLFDLASYMDPVVPPWNTLPMAYVYALGDATAWPDRYAIQQYESWEHQAFGLWPVKRGSYDFNIAPGIENKIGFQLDQSQRLPMAPQDYYISRAAIQPMDVRIEAVMYAQNRSFFVIPGEWFNTDPDDLLANVGRRDPMTAGGIEARWPFYGEPLDVRITVFGAISENMSASAGDTGAWMEKWGWIPGKHGNSLESTIDYRPPLDPSNAADPKRKGLTIIYDDLLSHPVIPVVPTTSPATFTPLRRDIYGRPLPIAPKLPVSPQTIYTGKPT
jgi:hypothetical protein